MQSPRRDFGSAEAKKVSDALEYNKKPNFQDNTLANYDFRKYRGLRLPCQFIRGHVKCQQQKRSDVWQLNNINILRVITNSINCFLKKLTEIYDKTNNMSHMVRRKPPEDKILQLIKFFKDLLCVFNFG